MPQGLQNHGKTLRICFGISAPLESEFLERGAMQSEAVVITQVEQMDC